MSDKRLDVEESPHSITSSKRGRVALRVFCELLLLLTLWTALIAGLSTLVHVNAFVVHAHWFAVVLSVLTVGLLAARVNRAFGLRASFFTGSRQYNVAVLLLVFGFIGVTLSATDQIPRFVYGFSLHQYRAQLDQYRTDPEGFPVLLELAKTYNKQLLLAEAVDAWADTTLNDIPNISPASMHVRPGYCELHANPAVIHLQVGSLSGTHFLRFLQGIGAHEFAHCLDIGADVDQASAQAVGQESVHPLDRLAFMDAIGFSKTYAMPKTKVWREGLSDIFTVGFWKLMYPQDADQYMELLLEKRVESQQGKHPDKDHDTACWIRVARRVPPPDSAAGLLSWARLVRDSSGCSLEAAPGAR